MATTLRSLFVLTGLALAAGACTDAGLCVRGEEGCACRTAGGCDPGLSCQEGFCVVSKDDPPDAGGRDAGPQDAGSPDAGGRDDAGPPQTCSGSSRAAACRNFCEAFCQNQQRLCVESQCPDTACDMGGPVFDACMMTCDDAACAKELCTLEGERRCEMFGFDEMGVYQSGCLRDDPLCALNPGAGCSDTCGSNRVGSGGDFAGDGVCDDGSEGGDQLCPRGADCSDCTMADACEGPSDGCDGNGVCCGYFVDEQNAGAFCVELESGAECLIACTRTGECPDGMRCAMTDDGLTSVCAP